MSIQEELLVAPVDPDPQPSFDTRPISVTERQQVMDVEYVAHGYCADCHDYRLLDQLAVTEPVTLSGQPDRFMRYSCQACGSVRTDVERRFHRLKDAVVILLLASLLLFARFTCGDVNRDGRVEIALGQRRSTLALAVHASRSLAY